jgi:hypothetical protein
MSLQFLTRIAFAALPALALGCTESTTSEDVSEARQDVAEEQQDVADERHEAMKPTLGDETDASDIDAGEAEDIQEEKQDVADAQQDLAETERDFQATQARDAFALESQTALDEADQKIAALEARYDTEEGAAAEATQQQIDDLKSRRSRLAEALDDLKGADLKEWQSHKASVQLAASELQTALRKTQ